GSRAARAGHLQICAVAGPHHRGDPATQTGRQGGRCHGLAGQAIQPGPAVGHRGQSARLSPHSLSQSPKSAAMRGRRPMNSPKRILAALAVAYAASLPAYADCDLPPAPSKIPDGTTASQQEMVTAMQTLKEYSADVDTYLKCLEFEAKHNHLTGDEADRMHN